MPEFRERAVSGEHQVVHRLVGGGDEQETPQRIGG